ncbi:MAG: extracellular solute-binding protein [Rubrimonas sp.]|uniref:extracellular solute-binding protein n=1 Tax=Rubrimonas sp. TaxID=2036015 RepID=UPI002FDEF756
MRITRRGFGAMSAAAAAAMALRPRLARAETVIRTHGGSLIGELRYPEDFPHFGYVNPSAPKGGVARIATQNSFDSFNPFIVRGDAPIGIGLIFDALMTPSLDEGSTHYGLLAEWEEHPEDDSWVAFKLRDEARWHDGRPITPEDVIWTFRTLFDKGAPYYRFYYANVTGARDMGGNVVRFDFDQSGNRELPHIMGQLAVLPKHWWEGRDFEAPDLTPPLGSGPYRVGAFEPGRFIEYERVADYWGADVNVNRGAHNFDRIRYEIFLDASAGLDAFRGGLIDFREENSASNWAERYDFEAVRDGRVKREEIALEGPKRVQYLAMNLRRAKFQDLRTRRALALAFDFEWTNRTIYFEQYARPSSYFEGAGDLQPSAPPEGLELEMLKPFRDSLPPEVFGEPYAPHSTDGSGRNRQGLRQAARLLEEAGWRQGRGGRLESPSGEPFTIEFLSAQDAQERVIGPYIANLKTLGIDATFRIVDGPQYIRRVSQDPNFDFDMIIWGVGNSESPGNEQREFWGSEAAGRMGSRNVGGVADPAVDSLIERIVFAPDRETLAAASRALDRVLTHNQYGVLQLYTPFERVAWWDRFGRPETTPSRSVGFPTVWWHDSEREAALGARR